MAENVAWPELTPVEHIRRYSLILSDPNPEGHDIVPTLLALSHHVESGEISEDKYPVEFTELRAAFKKSAARILRNPRVVEQIELLRKDYPADHWWWYPDKV